ncbi:four-carbon acid sugar kinase family protein [Brucellaceae bacterium C25G]
MLAILADDMTGALDSAAPFAGRGLHTEIALSVDALTQALKTQPDILSVNLGSREQSEAKARELSAKAAALLPVNATIFKKIDSRLKGHIEAELAPFALHKAIIAPAIPEFKRIVHNGYLQGFGVDKPLNVRSRFGTSADNALIPDTQTSEDMINALKHAHDAGVNLYVGARGLAEALASHMTSQKKSTFKNLPQGETLLVIGSRDPITIRQIEKLLNELPIRHIEAPNGVVVDERSMQERAQLTLVQATESHKVISGDIVAKNLARSVHPQLTKFAKTILMSGGETAHALMQTMAIDHFRLLGECLPGLAVAQHKGQYLVAKSGGFGDPETLIKIAKQTSLGGVQNED